jgi:hypothetical protein
METKPQYMSGFYHQTPHSLGKLIEWKHPTVARNYPAAAAVQAPHLLGKLIEWKLNRPTPARIWIIRKPYL